MVFFLNTRDCSDLHIRYNVSIKETLFTYSLFLLYYCFSPSRVFFSFSLEKTILKMFLFAYTCEQQLISDSFDEKSEGCILEDFILFLELFYVASYYVSIDISMCIFNGYRGQGGGGVQPFFKLSNIKMSNENKYKHSQSPFSGFALVHVPLAQQDASSNYSFLGVTVVFGRNNICLIKDKTQNVMKCIMLSKNQIS